MNRTFTNRFQNELGHDIYVRAAEKEVAGTPSVVLYMAGPDSDTELEITRNEALELYRLLEKVLKPRGRA
jgi:hypothetical protein